jgi:replicative superfamily II helicase
MPTGSIKSGTEKDDIILKFMAMTIERINACNATIHAMQMLMIEKGIASEKEIIQNIKDSKEMPIRKIGRKVLAEILEESSVDRLAQMIHIPE